LKRLTRKDDYNECCHNVRNALTCLGLATKKIETLMGKIDMDLDTADEIRVCFAVIKKESTRMESALSNSLQIWREVAEELEGVNI